MIRGITLSAFAFLVTAPAMAQTARILDALAGQLDAAATPDAQLGAYAACLLGNGDAAVTAAYFSDAGWSVTADIEMGVTEILPPEGSLYVAIYMDGEICSVENTAQGTAMGTATLSAFVSMAGIDAQATEVEGCTGWTFGAGNSVGITSGGQDPVCHSETDNQVRFTISQN